MVCTKTLDSTGEHLSGSAYIVPESPDWWLCPTIPLQFSLLGFKFSHYTRNVDQMGPVSRLIPLRMYSDDHWSHPKSETTFSPYWKALLLTQ